MAGLTREERARRRAAAELANSGVEMSQITPPDSTDEAEVPRVSILERRLQNPLGVPAAPVRLKDRSQFPRWFNSSLVHDRFWAAQNLGWVGVKPEDVIDLKQIGGYGKSPDGYIVRGERGQEMLMSIPKTFWDQLQLAKTKKNLEMMRDTQGEQARALEAAGKQFGDEVATGMEGVKRKMVIHDNLERVERTPGSELE